MLNKNEFYRGLADGFIKDAGAFDWIKSKGMSLANSAGRFVGGLAGSSAENGDPNGTPGFTDAFWDGARTEFTGSKGFRDQGNKYLDANVGGAVQLDEQNQPKIQFGKAINHFGGKAVDWLQDNPGKALLGGAGILGSGMLLSGALGGNSNQYVTPPATPPQQVAPVTPPRRFAFAKPGMMG